MPNRLLFTYTNAFGDENQIDCVSGFSGRLFNQTFLLLKNYEISIFALEIHATMSI